MDLRLSMVAFVRSFVRRFFWVCVESLGNNAVVVVTTVVYESNQIKDVVDADGNGNGYGYIAQYYQKEDDECRRAGERAAWVASPFAMV